MSLQAAGAGALAACASAAAKIAFSHDEAVKLGVYLELRNADPTEVEWAIRLSLMATFIFCNVKMWTLHADALRLCRTTLQAVIINTAINFMLTGLIGVYIFEEIHEMLWWFGLSCIICGTALVTTAQGSDTKKEQ